MKMMKLIEHVDDADIRIIKREGGDYAQLLKNVKAIYADRTATKFDREGFLCEAFEQYHNITGRDALADIAGIKKFDWFAAVEAEAEEATSRRRDKRKAVAAAASRRSENLTNKRTYMDNLQHIISDFGLAPLCKHIIDNGVSNITEQEFVDAVGAYAKAATRDSKASAFSRMYQMNDETGALLREAVQALRHRDMHGATASKASASALDELNAKAAELRKVEPQLTDAQAFSKVYQDPANKELRQREVRERWS
jgi:hypothetical protein